MAEHCERPHWKVIHVNHVGLAGKPDSEVYSWACVNQAIIVTFDEDFADARFYPLGSHHGVVRLRVWPTTIEETKAALGRLLSTVPEDDWRESLIIIHQNKIRIRRRPFG